jgi:hypothetical protein
VDEDDGRAGVGRGGHQQRGHRAGPHRAHGHALGHRELGVDLLEGDPQVLDRSLRGLFQRPPDLRDPAQVLVAERAGRRDR